MNFRPVATMVLSLCCAAALAQPTSTSSGQVYPTKPIRVVIE